MSELIYAKKLSNGEIVSIKDVPLSECGLSCGCVCPVCNEPLEACALESEKVSSYFRHHTDTNCNVNHANESALHQMAKKVIHNNTCILLPQGSVSLEETSFGGLPKSLTASLPRSFQYFKEGHSMYSFVGEEVCYQDIKVDSVINTPCLGDVLVEFAVTHFVDAEKLCKIKKLDKPLLEFDLGFYRDTPVSYEDLENIITSGECASWKWFSEDARKKAEEFFKGKYYSTSPKKVTAQNLATCFVTARGKEVGRAKVYSDVFGDKFYKRFIITENDGGKKSNCFTPEYMAEDFVKSFLPDTLGYSTVIVEFISGKMVGKKLYFPVKSIS